MFSLFRQRPIRPTRPKTRLRSLEALETRNLMAADPLPVLMVIANRDFYYQEYGDTRQSLEEAGLKVEVAATSTAVSSPHASSGQGSGSGLVTPDISLSEADASNYSAIVFVGGWGSSSYQYAFSGTYANAAYNGDTATKAAVNDLVNEMLAGDKPVSAICHGVSALAWARVDGVSPLQGKQVAAYAGGSPGVTINGVTYAPGALPTRWHIETNGGIQFASGSIGDPATATDDVYIDGRIITAENYDSARQFGRVVGQEVIKLNDAASPPTVEKIEYNGGAAQRSMVRSLTVTFTATVQLDRGAIQITKLGTAGGSIATHVSRSLVDGKTVLKLTFASQTLAPGGSLSDGNYRLTIRADRIRNVAGTALDGDRDGLAGGNARDDFFRLFGDSDGDRDVDAVDRDRFRAWRKKSEAGVGYHYMFDADGDRDIDSADAAEFYARYGTKLLS
jgi:putative intracellular protease/amidase